MTQAAIDKITKQVGNLLKSETSVPTTSKPKYDKEKLARAHNRAKEGKIELVGSHKRAFAEDQVLDQLRKSETVGPSVPVVGINKPLPPIVKDVEEEEESSGSEYSIKEKATEKEKENVPLVATKQRAGSTSTNNFDQIPQSPRSPTRTLFRRNTASSVQRIQKGSISSPKFVSSSTWIDDSEDKLEKPQRPMPQDVPTSVCDDDDDGDGDERTLQELQEELWNAILQMPSTTIAVPRNGARF